MQSARKATKYSGTEYGNDRKDYQHARRHPADFQFVFIVLFTRCGMGPSPPSHQVGDKEKHLQKHVGIELSLIK